MSLTMYHNPRRSRSRATLKPLRDRGLEPPLVRYLDTAPGAVPEMLPEH